MKYTLNELRARHSVRAFSSLPVDEDTRNKLKAEVTYINSHEAGLNFRLVFDDGAPFDGFMRSYGFFKGVRNYLVAIVDPTFPDAVERAGYFGEQFVMFAQQLKLGTCFVGGTFSSSHIPERIEVYEKVAFLIPFGYPADKAPLTQRLFGGKKNRPDGRPFFDGSEEDYAEALRLLPALPEALDALVAAPSALNKRPVRIFLKRVEEDGNVRSFLAARTISSGKFSAIDLGVAKFNFCMISGGSWEWGQGGMLEWDN